jgi:hypothetical protein
MPNGPVKAAIVGPRRLLGLNLTAHGSGSTGSDPDTSTSLTSWPSATTLVVDGGAVPVAMPTMMEVSRQLSGCHQRHA